MALAHDASTTNAGAGTTPSAASAFLAAMNRSEWAAGAPAAAHPDEVLLPATATEAVTERPEVVLGENLNPIHTYSKEHVSVSRVLQLMTDMTRLSDDTWDNPETVVMRTKLRETLGATHAILSGALPAGPAERAEAERVGRMLCLAVGHTRDIVDGKGERMLAYLLIAEHYQVAPEVAVQLVPHLVRLYTEGPVGDGDVGPVVAEGHQYGSWADVKRLSAFLRDHYAATVEHPLIQEALSQLAAQLRTDIARLAAGEGSGYSLAARWSPKATGAGKWLYRSLALMVYPYHQTARTPAQVEAAGRKAEGALRRQLSALNRLIKTVEVLMSSTEGEWHKIEFGSLPSQALRRHVRAWKNETKAGEERFVDNEDRAACLAHYTEHMAKVAKGEATVKGARCGPAELVYDVRSHGGADDARINGQWVSKMKELPQLGKTIAMVDCSGSMDTATLPGSKHRAMDAAIGLGLAVAAKGEAPFNNRVLSFATDPKFLTFREDTAFADRVRQVQRHDVGYSTDFRKACKAILDVAVKAGASPDFFRGLTLFVLSDMQINCGMAQWSPDLAAEVKEMFAKAGLASPHREPYDAPFIVMWNLASTTTMATTKDLVGAASVSGYSDAMLKAFEADGVEGLLKMTPAEFLREQLESPRYAPLAEVWEQYA
jgi:hypothetical protein